MLTANDILSPEEIGILNELIPRLDKTCDSLAKTNEVLRSVGLNEVDTFGCRLARIDAGRLLSRHIRALDQQREEAIERMTA